MYNRIYLRVSSSVNVLFDCNKLNMGLINRYRICLFKLWFMTSFTSNCVYNPSILVYIYIPAHKECVTVCEEFTCYLPIWIPARKFSCDWTFFALFREQIVAFSFIILIVSWLWETHRGTTKLCTDFKACHW